MGKLRNNLLSRDNAFERCFSKSLDTIETLVISNLEDWCEIHICKLSCQSELNKHEKVSDESTTIFSNMEQIQTSFFEHGKDMNMFIWKQTKFEQTLYGLTFYLIRTNLLMICNRCSTVKSIWSTQWVQSTSGSWLFFFTHFFPKEIFVTWIFTSTNSSFAR